MQFDTAREHLFPSSLPDKIVDSQPRHLSEHIPWIGRSLVEPGGVLYKRAIGRGGRRGAAPLVSHYKLSVDQHARIFTR